MRLEAFKVFLRIELTLCIAWCLLLFFVRFVLAMRKSQRSAEEAPAGNETGIAMLLRSLVTPDKRFVRLVGIGVIGAVAQIPSIELIHFLGREELRAFIDAHRHGLQVIVRGQQVAKPEEYLEVIASTHFVFAHHSHPIDKFPVVLVAPTGERTYLILGQDSHNPLEYWVFFAPYGLHRYDEIGRTYTPLFKTKQL